MPLQEKQKYLKSAFQEFLKTMARLQREQNKIITQELKKFDKKQEQSLRKKLGI